MSDRDAFNTPSTHLGEADKSGLSINELEAELNVLAEKCKVMTIERDEYKTELNNARKRLEQLEDREKALVERLDFIEKLIISTLNEDVN